MRDFRLDFAEMGEEGEVACWFEVNGGDDEEGSALWSKRLRSINRYTGD